MDPTDLLSPDGVLRQTHWHVVRRLEGRLQGDYRSLLRGTGTDLYDLRSYEWGDDVRRIDWNATARLDELVVRDFVEDRELTAWLVLDRSRSMAFGPPGRTKEDVLRRLAAVAGQLLLRNGNRVGAVISDGEQQWVLPPGQGRNHLLLLVDSLLRPLQASPTTDLAGLFATADRIARRRSLAVVISDFVGAPGWERPLLRLTRRHEVVAVRVVDPREYELPAGAGLLYVRDAETGEVLVDAGDPGFVRRLRALAAERDDAIARAVARARAQLHTVSTEEDVLGAFVRLASHRRHVRR